MKIFISQPMRTRTNEEIETERKEILDLVKKVKGEDVVLIDSFFKDAPHEAKPLWFMGESIKKMAEADLVVFAPFWETARGCRIEHSVAKEYGLNVFEMEKPYELRYTD